MSSEVDTSPSKKVKTEDSNELNQLAKIKSEEKGKNGGEEDVDHSILSDPEDYLEEDETLDMNLTNGSQKIWLVKLPRYLAEKWSNTQELSGKNLGTIKIKQGGGQPNKKKLQVKLVLNDEQKDVTIPQEYDLSVLNTLVKNSYVFSEENLKKFKQELTEVTDMPDQPTLPSLDKQQKTKPYKFFRVQKNRVGLDGKPVKKFVPFVKTIPKKTNLVGKIVHDCQIIPSKTDGKYNEIMMKKRQNIEQAKPRPKVTLLEEIPGVIQSNAGPSIKGNNTSVFLKSTHNKNKNDGRAIRMPKKDLLDLLFRLFEEYEYWSMKGLKERTRQPESYLKESLESIANLIKKGPYTSKYNLKPEYRRLRDAERAARLGIELDDNKDDDKDEDDDIEMEDVV